MEYRYVPKPQNKNATYLVTALGLLTLLMLGLGMGNLGGLRTLWHALFLPLAVATIFFFLRYFSSAYLYVITEEWGEPTLVINRIQGRRLSVHCRLGLSNLLGLVEVADASSPEGREALLKFRAERVRYSYLATVGAAQTQILYGREGGQRFAIRIEGDAAFLGVLRDAATRAALYKKEDDEDDE